VRKLAAVATVALSLALVVSASAETANTQASCQALVNSSFAGQPGARAVELQDAFAEAADLGVPVGAVLSEFSRSDSCFE
jgi:uncharacterized membrane-anchored protein